MSNTAERLIKDEKYPKSLATGVIYDQIQFKNCHFIDLSIVAHNGRVHQVPVLANEILIHDIFEDAILT